MHRLVEIYLNILQYGMGKVGSGFPQPTRFQPETWKFPGTLKLKTEIPGFYKDVFVRGERTVFINILLD